MTTLISVTRKLQVEALVRIENKSFEHWYELGVWWALWGDEQGKGQYEDRYLIDNIVKHIESGKYGDLTSPEFEHLGFYIGMIHGGCIDPQTHRLQLSENIVQLTDPDFTKGYHVGRDYYFLEAPESEKPPTDIWLMGVIHEWALDYHTWHEKHETLSYVLGCRIGALSAGLVPKVTPAIAANV